MAKLYINQNGDHLVEEISRDDGRVSFCPAGGGFVVSMAEEDFARKYTETTLPAVLSPFRFSGEWLNADYPGYTNGKRWNGWAVPLVTKETLVELVAVMEPANAALGGEGYKFHWDGDVLNIYDPQEDSVYALEPRPLATTEGTKFLYDISLGWCWETSTTEA